MTRKRAIGILLAFLVVLFLFLEIFLLQFHLKIPLQELEETIRAHTFWGPLIYIILGILAVVTAPILSLVPFIPFANHLWGFLGAMIYAFIGWTIGAIIAFYLGRKFGRPFVKKLVPIEKIDEFEEALSQKTKLLTLTFLRIIIPIDGFSYVLSLTKINTRTYLFTTLIGALGQAIVLTYLGGLLFLIKSPIVLSILILLSVIVILIYRQSWFFYLKRKDPWYSEKAALKQFNKWAPFWGKGVIFALIQSVHKKTLELVRGHIKPGAVVVDVGCGTGIFTKQIAELVPQGRVEGIDISPEMIKIAKKEQSNIPNISFIKARVHNLPFQDESVNIIFVIDTFHHLPKIDRALAEFYRILIPGGKLVIADPDISTLLGKILFQWIGSVIEHFERLFTKEEIKKLLIENHFSILNQETFRLHHFTVARK